MAFGKLTPTNVAAALLEHRGNLLMAAKALDCSRTALYKYLDAHPELEEVREEARETLLDIAESTLTTNIVKGEDIKTTLWYLERAGKNRGYSTRNETTGADGGPLNFDVSPRDIVEPDDASE